MPYFKSDPDNDKGLFMICCSYAKKGITRNVKTFVLRYLKMKQKRKTGNAEDASKETLKHEKLW